MGATFLIRQLGLLVFILTILKIITPILIGYIIAWLFNPLVLNLENKGIKRVFSTIIVYSVFLALLYLFFRTLIPAVYKQLLDFLESVPDILTKGENLINNLFSKVGRELNVEVLKQNITNTMLHFGNDIIKNMPTTIINSLTGILSGIGVFGLSIILGFYILLDFEKFKLYLINILPFKKRYEVSHFMEVSGSELRKSVNGTLFVAGLVFLGALIGFLIIGLTSPLLFAFFCGLTDLIPFIGPLIGGCLAVIAGFSQSSFIGLSTLIVVFVVQQVENIVIQPLVMSKSMHLHPVLIIGALLIAAHYFGIVGMIFATPVLGVSKIIYRFLIAKFTF